MKPFSLLRYATLALVALVLSTASVPLNAQTEMSSDGAVLAEEDGLSSGMTLSPVSKATLDRTEAAQHFAEAQRLYDAGQFDSAIVLYEGLLAQGYQDFALNYNLGNAYYKAGQIGPSILHFERAKKREPQNPDLIHNLEMANLRQQDKKIEPLPKHFFNRFWSGFTWLFNQTTWAIMAIVSAWTILLGLGLIWLSLAMSWRRLGLGLVLTAFFVLGISLAGGYGRQKADARQHFGIILSPSVVLKSAPSSSSTDLYILREGFKLQITDQTGSWLQVRLPDGNVGWVNAGALEEV